MKLIPIQLNPTSNLRLKSARTNFSAGRERDQKDYPRKRAYLNRQEAKSVLNTLLGKALRKQSTVRVSTDPSHRGSLVFITPKLGQSYQAHMMALSDRLNSQLIRNTAPEEKEDLHLRALTVHNNDTITEWSAPTSIQFMTLGDHLPHKRGDLHMVFADPETPVPLLSTKTNPFTQGQYIKALTHLQPHPADQLQNRLLKKAILALEAGTGKGTLNNINDLNTLRRGLRLSYSSDTAKDTANPVLIHYEDVTLNPDNKPPDDFIPELSDRLRKGRAVLPDFDLSLGRFMNPNILQRRNVSVEITQPDFNRTLGLLLLPNQRNQLTLGLGEWVSGKTPEGKVYAGRDLQRFQLPLINRLQRALENRVADLGRPTP